MNEKQKILKAYEDTISEAPKSDKEGWVLSKTGDALNFINKARNIMNKDDPHWPDVWQNIKKAKVALGLAEKKK